MIGRTIRRGRRPEARLNSLRGCALVAALVGGFFGVERAQAGTAVTNLPFAVNGASMWDTGAGFLFQTGDFLGVQWDQDFNIGPLLGLELDGNINGKIGLEYGVTVSSGTVNASYPAQASLSYPDQANAGTLVTLNSSSMLTAPAAFSSLSPQVDVHVGVPVQLGSSATGSFHVAPFPSIPIPFPTINVDTGLTLFDLNGANPSVDINFLGFGTVTASLPIVDTSGMSAGGPISTSASDSFVDLNVDLDGILTTFVAGFPALSGGIDLGGIANFNYNLLDADALLGLGLGQAFDFNPALKVRYTLETGQQFVLGASDPLSFLMPTKAQVGETLEVGVEYFLENTLTNTTSLAIDPVGVQVSALAIGLELFGLNILNVGPLVDETLATNFDIPVYSNSFALDFPLFTTQISIAVPEPAGAVLAMVGLVGSLPVLRRRARTRRG